MLRHGSADCALLRHRRRCLRLLLDGVALVLREAAISPYGKGRMPRLLLQALRRVYARSMESLSRFHLGQDENGAWHVVDAKRGGPAEIQVDGKFYLLWGISKVEAENWSLLLNQIIQLHGERQDGQTR